jgi:hypothetical protein
MEAETGHSTMNPPLHTRRFVWPSLLTLATCASGMAYSIWWPAVVRHNSRYWVTPGDFWSTIRAAHYVGWGGLSFVYSSRAVFVTLPGFATLLSPFAMFGSRLGLTESAPGIYLPNPQIWLLVGPVALLMSGVALFGLDALAIRSGVGTSSRRALLVAEAVLLWPATAVWGHPEDAVAIGLLAFALVAVWDDRWAIAGWVLGVAIAMQLLVLLAVPIFIGVAGARKAGPLLTRASILPGFFAIAVIVPNFDRSLAVLTKQPTFPLIDHPTPWVHLSPTLAPHVVAAGPSRLLAGAVALGAGWMARRWRDDLPMVVFALAVVFAGRCIFESVMVPYYVMPTVCMAVLVSFVGGWARRLTTLTAAVVLTVVTFYRVGEWRYYVEMVGLLAVMLAAALPTTGHRTQSVVDAVADGDTAWIDQAPAILGAELAG